LGVVFLLLAACLLAFPFFSLTLALRLEVDSQQQQHRRIIIIIPASNEQSLLSLHSISIFHSIRSSSLLGKFIPLPNRRRHNPNCSS